MDFKYNAPPTIRRFLRSKAHSRFIRGPVGSGKSVGCCMNIFLVALGQHPGTDGVRRTRFTVVRNTADQLKDTTYKTWKEWFPDRCEMGYYAKTDRTYYFDFTPPDGIPVYAEVMFRALDDPDDVAKVLSLEVTCIWFNECREIERTIVEHAYDRCGRYPSPKLKPPEIPMTAWPTYWGMFGDTNAPIRDSYWYNVFEHLPCDEEDDQSVLDCETFEQPPGTSSDAENVENLRTGYYERGGRSEEEFNTMVLCQYGRSLSGKPVYEKSFKRDRHVSEVPLKIYADLPAIIGIDGARKPAAIFMQLARTGKLLVQHETRELDIGAKTFIEQYIKPMIRNFYPQHALVFVLDPACTRRNDTDDNSWYKELKKQFPGAWIKLAETNDPIRRINATDELLRNWPDGDPGILFDPSCKWIIQGLNGKYRYSKVKISADIGRYADTPDKNSWSHPVEAMQYGHLFLSGKLYRPEEYVRHKYNPVTGKTSYQPADKYAGY